MPSQDYNQRFSFTLNNVAGIACIGPNVWSDIRNNRDILTAIHAEFDMDRNDHCKPLHLSKQPESGR